MTLPALKGGLSSLDRKFIICGQKSNLPKNIPLLFPRPNVDSTGKIAVYGNRADSPAQTDGVHIEVDRRRGFSGSERYAGDILKAECLRGNSRA
jgi:hypothetical protein